MTIGLGLLLIVFGIILTVRNFVVSRYRTAMLLRVYEAANRDAADDRDYDWRFEEMGAVSYDQMFWLFWKPLKSFYPKDPARRNRSEEVARQAA